MIATDIKKAIFDSYEREFNGQFRPHLGASIGGDPCLRKLWYSFRHVKHVNFDGRMLKLFQFGHKEEQTFIEDLARAGIRVVAEDENGNQFRLGTDKNKHIGGSSDGFGEVQTDNILNLVRGEWVNVEMKTHSLKSFAKLEKEGVRASKPLHYSQMQTYMGWTGTKKAIYIAVNKNTSELYLEIIMFEQNEFERVERNMIHVVESECAPQRLHTDPSRFECKYCDYSDICHTGKFDLHISCRNCAYTQTNSDGTWTCRKNKTILKNFTPCDSHVIEPSILESITDQYEPNGVDGIEYIEYVNPTTGEILRNGKASNEHDIINSVTFANKIASGQF